MQPTVGVTRLLILAAAFAAVLLVAAPLAAEAAARQFCSPNGDVVRFAGPTIAHPYIQGVPSGLQEIKLSAATSLHICQ